MVLEKLEEKLSSLEPSGFVKNKVYSKFLTIEKTATKIDEQKIKNDERFDGK
ncbi:hypothetical protein [Halalkalibacter hemicellulosilyticus]|uniref:Uncharacterized protein n=1 Tax=Halalkalibacter hemicellulosilyticusJCM 9152 TaxID=1236971 RepID=W4QL56_9BACI|nr:hypothetical protein [Halalkalibacter hemicellulosilyticus]GAE32821.1 hypothetical protein JCM9152_4402 [Halalkalibacter hemicellulosilyticusJCM 9152]